MTRDGLKILIDANVAYTFLSGRDDPYLVEAQEIMTLCAKEKVSGCLALHSLSIIWYLLRKLRDTTRRDMLIRLCKILTVIGTSHEQVVAAIQNDVFGDFEDCLQDKCAREAHCDYIVTANLKDFRHSEIQAVTPEELLKILRQAIA